MFHRMKIFIIIFIYKETKIKDSGNKLFSGEGGVQNKIYTPLLLRADYTFWMVKKI